MKTKKVDKAIPENFVYNKELDKYPKKNSFPEKVALANSILKKYGGIKQLNKA